MALQGTALSRASLTESLPAVRARSRLTTRLRTELGDAIAEQGRVVSECAAHYGVDCSIVHAAFVEHVRGLFALERGGATATGVGAGSDHRPVGVLSYAKDVREALPDAVLVADRFHLVALANDMLTQFRQRVLRDSCGRRGRNSDPAWSHAADC
jgi:hypothetical protein